MRSLMAQQLGRRTLTAGDQEGGTMAETDPWPMIRAEREALADDLETLDVGMWETPSLCAGWSVADLVAHITSTAETTVGGFVGDLVKARFSFDRMNDAGIAAERKATPMEAAQRLRAVAASRKHPPGPVDSWLGEAVIHGEDIRRPLGISHVYAPAALTRVADFYKKSNLIVGAKKRIAGVTLRATDADWTHGSGPEVAGPLVALILAMTGRTAVLEDLEGGGVDLLRGRS
jgi:uncharacterized protein (TIGR03083 family)